MFYLYSSLVHITWLYSWVNVTGGSFMQFCSLNSQHFRVVLEQRKTEE